MTIADDAAVALSASGAELEAAALTHLGAVLGAGPARKARVAHVDVASGLVVAGDGSVSLAVLRRGDDWEVRVVTGGEGDWTRGPVVGSLAELGEHLAERTAD